MGQSMSTTFPLQHLQARRPLCRRLITRWEGAVVGLGRAGQGRGMELRWRLGWSPLWRLYD